MQSSSWSGIFFLSLRTPRVCCHTQQHLRPLSVVFRIVVVVVLVVPRFLDCSRVLSKKISDPQVTFGIQMRGIRRQKHIEQFRRAMTEFSLILPLVSVVFSMFFSFNIFSYMWMPLSIDHVKQHICLNRLTEADVFEICG